jgi:threonine/homoserine/homoserine lactone efflux protein
MIEFLTSVVSWACGLFLIWICVGMPGSAGPRSKR